MSRSLFSATNLRTRRLTDDAVFTRALSGDEHAHAEVYRRYHDRIHAFCLSRLLDAHAAAEATQEVFVRLLAAPPGSVQHPRAWLYGVARHVIADHRRRLARSRETVLPEGDLPELPGDGVDALRGLVADEEAAHAYLALRRLRPRYRTAIVMRDLHSRSSCEIGEALGTTAATADTVVCRARDAFGREFAEVARMPGRCRQATELIYRAAGTGLDRRESLALSAHLLACPACRSEADRAERHQRLAALIPLFGGPTIEARLADVVSSAAPVLGHLPERLLALLNAGRPIPRIAATALATTAVTVSAAGAGLYLQYQSPAPHFGSVLSERRPPVAARPAPAAASDDALASGIPATPTRVRRASGNAVLRPASWTRSREAEPVTADAGSASGARAPRRQPVTPPVAADARKGSRVSAAGAVPPSQGGQGGARPGNGAARPKTSRAGKGANAAPMTVAKRAANAAAKAARAAAKAEAKAAKAAAKAEAKAAKHDAPGGAPGAPAISATQASVSGRSADKGRGSASSSAAKTR